MHYIVGIIEIIIYLLFVIYSICIPVTSYFNKRKLQGDYHIINNPQTAFSMIMSKAVLILSLPSMILMFTIIPQNPNESKTGIYIYFGIFLFLMFLGCRALITSKGDYYIDNNGIHFVRNEKFDIKFEDIQNSKWLDYSHIGGASSTTELVVNGKHIKFYNLSKGQYAHYISKENILTPKHEPVKSIYKKIFSIIVVVLFVLGVSSGFVSGSFTSFHGGGSALTETANYSYLELLSNPNIPHYLVDHGQKTEVTFVVWKTALIMERIWFILYPLMFLCLIINVIWENQIHRKRYK